MAVQAMAADVLVRLGARPVINAAGSASRLGGTTLEPEVRAAMDAASQAFVPIVELQALASEAIARATGAEAGCVASGAAACLFLAAAACLAGLDPAAMDRLPETSGMPNEIAVHRAHRYPYDHALRAAGARLVEFGYLGHASPGTRAWQLEAALTDRTVAVAYPARPAPHVLSLETVTAIAHRHDLPVIVDAAEMLPPPENLRRYLAEGADLVVFSGGKALGAPAASGFLAGRRDLVLSATAQQQDMYVRPESWSGPEAGDTAAAMPEPPQQGIGRIAKVGREEIVGLIVALERFVARDHAADLARWSAMAASIVDAVSAGSSVRARVVGPPASGVPVAVIGFTADAGRDAAAALSRRLRASEPRIFASEEAIDANELVVNVQHVTDEQLPVVIARLQDLLPAR